MLNETRTKLGKTERATIQNTLMYRNFNGNHRSLGFGQAIPLVEPFYWPSERHRRAPSWGEGESSPFCVVKEQGRGGIENKILCSSRYSSELLSTSQAFWKKDDGATGESSIDIFSSDELSTHFCSPIRDFRRVT
ncbi:hypothetical protein NPIL_153411 [Nephila pilipes]|uniref:Uncharacterized protein n=1 Tax=Nephila pilipes TaxID=299642 RepID=A0A8X6NLD2_NEPPI|nr:hypothetical protein NPIL_153411 [Nephila pilipes]